MATKRQFRVEYGIKVGTTEVINSSGKLVSSAISALTTDNLGEGSTNQYHSNSRARSAISVSSGGGALSYNNSSGELSLSIDGGTY